MGKRPIHEDGALTDRKRPRIDYELPTFEAITDCRQLVSLLVFDQNVQRLRHGLQSFKSFLDSISASKGEDDIVKIQSLSLLKEFLEEVKPPARGQDAIYLPTIMEMWAFAVDLHNDAVMSSVAVVLDLLLRILSHSLDLIPHAIGICNTLLQDRQLRSIGKNLSSEKHKAFVISPTLRLLREAVLLDGGVVARRIFRARLSTMASLARNLEVKHLGDGVEDPAKSSVRTNAIRFLLACFKILPPEAKRELLLEPNLVSHLTFMLQTDSPYLLRELLVVLRNHVMLDRKLLREAKFRTFNIKMLKRVLSLYTYDHDSSGDETLPSISQSAHEFLRSVCTDPIAGVLYPCKGLYPRGVDELMDAHGSQSVLGASKYVSLNDQYTEEVPVFNFVLSEFTAQLRPWSNIKHKELLVGIFKAAPELVSHYFVNNKSFTFEPKLTMTWVGYAAFLFSCIQLPVPDHFGSKLAYARGPPPTSIVMDHILPLPINQKVLVRCLGHDSRLVVFFASRLLILALEKLKRALRMHREHESNNALWADAEKRLMDAFCQRIPELKDVVRSYKSIPTSHAIHRVAATQVIRLYYEVVPQVALVLNFDVSPLVTASILSFEDQMTLNTEKHVFHRIELENIMSIASYSPGMRWFTRTEGHSTSAFTSLLRLMLRAKGKYQPPRLRSALDLVAVENQLVLDNTRLRPLHRSLRAFAEKIELSATLSDKLWSFLDDCFLRCSNSPVKYLELMKTLAQELSAPPEDDNNTAHVVSILTVTMLDQLSFSISAFEKKEITDLVSFLRLYLSYCSNQGESNSLLDVIRKKMNKTLPSSDDHKIKRLHRPDEDLSDLTAIQSDGEESNTESFAEKRSVGSALKKEEIIQSLQAPLLSACDASGLYRWVARSADDLIDEGYLRSVILLLLSEQLGIRKEALTNILKMTVKIRSSNLEDRDQIGLLLSELAESCCGLVDSGPVPSYFAAFAVHALDVLKNPLHCLYSKINKFLTKGPVWKVDRLPMAHEIFNGEPCRDDKYYTELAWLLTFLLDGLCTPSDLTVYQKKRWFEKILGLGSNPRLRMPLLNKIYKIIYRTTAIENGSSTLAIRFGAFSWLESRMASCRSGDETAICKTMILHLWSTCDRQQISTWSSQGVDRLVSRIDQV